MKKYLIIFFRNAWKTAKYAIFIIAAILILILISLSSAYDDLGAAAKQGLAGKAALTEASQATQAQDWSSALSRAQQAELHFKLALEKLNNTRDNLAVKNLGPIRTQVNDLENLVKTAEILSRSLVRILPLATDLNKITSQSGGGNFVDLPEADRAQFLRLIYESEPELNGLKANLALAALNLDKIHRLGVLWPVYEEISDIKNELRQISLLMDRLSPLVKLMPVLTGYQQESRFLLIFQNNDELRASGGFIGVYGLLTSKNGQIISLTSDDSYHLDAPASVSDNWRLEPPAAIKKYLKVEKWYLRDANWSPDWPTSARQIEKIFQGESRAIGQPAEAFTGLVAITPDFVSDLIRLVGPITVKGTTYNADNFQPLLQYNVEIAYKDQDIASWDRKEIINELIAELKNRLFSLSASGWTELFKILDRNIAKKNIQLYFPDAVWENLARDLGASGEVTKTENDYLLTVDSNLGAFKSDAVVKKKLYYDVREEADQLTATVRLNYRHEGKFDWRTTRYRSYTRIYAPLGSRLIALHGVDQATADINVTDDQNLGKTVFGFFFTVEPGSAREVSLSYRLPETIRKKLSSGQYQLLVQRQAGQRITSLDIWIKPLKGQEQRWSTDLESDQNFSL
ncbi:MAG: DUF4012 domain-containing protein [Patescibacteria group bacterium]